MLQANLSNKIYFLACLFSYSWDLGHTGIKQDLFYRTQRMRITSLVTQDGVLELVVNYLSFIRQSVVSAAVVVDLCTFIFNCNFFSKLFSKGNCYEICTSIVVKCNRVNVFAIYSRFVVQLLTFMFYTKLRVKSRYIISA